MLLDLGVRVALTTAGPDRDIAARMRELRDLLLARPELLVPDHPDRPAVRREARALLAGCLLPQTAAIEPARSRRAR